MIMRTLSGICAASISLLMQVPADGHGIEESGASFRDPLLFLQGDLPGEYLMRQRWAPGWDSGSVRFLYVEYGSPPFPQGDSTRRFGSLAAGFQSEAGKTQVGGYLDLDRANLRNDVKNEYSATDEGFSGEAGFWIIPRGNRIRGIRLTAAADHSSGSRSTSDRAGDFADIRKFSHGKEDSRAVSLASLVSISSGQALRVSAFLSEADYRSDSGNAVRFDNPDLQSFNSTSALGSSRASNHFGAQLDYLIPARERSIFGIEAGGRLIDGHGLDGEALSDSLRMGVGGYWVHTVALRNAQYQFSLGADFEKIFFNSINDEKGYLGYIKPLDADNSRNILQAGFPQRMILDLGAHFNLVWGFSASLRYWSEVGKPGGVGNRSASSLDFDVAVDAPTVFFEAGKAFRMHIKPTGSINAPGAVLGVETRFP